MPCTVGGISMPQIPSKVGMMSTESSTRSIRVPGFTPPPGQRTRKGMRTDSSQGFCFLVSPWQPIMSPWSEAKTTAVFSARPQASSSSSKRPKHSSRASMWA